MTTDRNYQYAMILTLIAEKYVSKVDQPYAKELRHDLTKWLIATYPTFFHTALYNEVEIALEAIFERHSKTPSKS